MKKFIDLKYDDDTKEISITYDGNKMDTEHLSEIPVAEWVNTFVKSGRRWYGLYEELKRFCGGQEFSIAFHGSDENWQLIKKILSVNNVEVFSENNKVTMIYDRATYTTKLNVNGKIFDTSPINGVPISEICNPIQDRNWKGIFSELQEYMNGLHFAVTFIGEVQDMNYLIPCCPDNVDLFCKTSTSKIASPKIASGAVLDTMNSIVGSVKTAVSSSAPANEHPLPNVSQTNDALSFQKVTAIVDICSIIGIFLISPFDSNPLKYKLSAILQMMKDNDERIPCYLCYFLYTALIAIVATYVYAFILKGDTRKQRKLFSFSAVSCGASWVAYVLMLISVEETPGVLLIIFAIIFAIIAVYLMLITTNHLDWLKGFQPKAEEIAVKLGLM